MTSIKFGLFVVGMLLSFNACAALLLTKELVKDKLPAYRVERKLECLNKCELSNEFELCVEQECIYWYEK